MVKTAVKRTGYTARTPKHYLINAGAIYKNLAWNPTGGKDGKGQWEGELLGATAGGNKVTVEVNHRVIEIDGVFMPAVGQKVLESQTAKLETNMKEITAENIRLAINGEIKDADGTNAPIGYKVDESELVAYIGTNCEYAIYVEFGTGEFAEKGNGRKGGWVYKTPNGEVHFTYGMPPQPYLRPAFRQNQKAIRDILADCLRELGG